MGFTSAGLPLGVTFSFLISSPMVDLGSLVLLMSIFGAKIAIAYVILGLVIAVIGGTLIEKLHMEDQIADFIRNSNSSMDIEAPDKEDEEQLLDWIGNKILLEENWSIGVVDDNDRTRVANKVVAILYERLQQEIVNDTMLSNVCNVKQCLL